MLYRESIVSLLCALVVCTSAPACGGGDSPEDRDSGSSEGPRYDESACANAVVPQRFGFRWEKVNHRISKWDLQLTESSEEDCRPRLLKTEIVGGNFSEDNIDRPTLQYGFQDRTAASARQLGTARRSLEVTISPSGVASGTETFDRDALDLQHFPRVIALIDGIRFDTDTEQPDSYPDDYNPAHGYTVHGIGASAEVSDLSEESVHVSYRLRFDPGASPDRDKLNRALEHARVEGRLDVLLVGTSAPTHAGSVSTTITHPKPENGKDRRFAPPPEQERLIALKGEPERPVGLYGLSSFEFELTPQINCEQDSDCPEGEACRSDGSCTEKFGEPGFYVRELSVDLRLDDYDRSSGEGLFVLTGFASNTSEFVAFWSMQTDFEGSMRWIQTAGASGAVRYSRDFQTGAATFPLVEMAN